MLQSDRFIFIGFTSTTDPLHLSFILQIRHLETDASFTFNLPKCPVLLPFCLNRIITGISENIYLSEQFFQPVCNMPFTFL